MATATLGSINERITEVDALIFKIETGQTKATWTEYRMLCVEAEACMEVLAKRLSELNRVTYEEAYEPRQKIRTLTRLAAILERHLELHPEERDQEDPEIKEAFETGNTELFERIMAQCDYLFDNCPRPPVLENPKGFLSRLFNRS